MFCLRRILFFDKVILRLSCYYHFEYDKKLSSSLGLSEPLCLPLSELLVNDMILAGGSHDFVKRKLRREKVLSLSATKA